VSGSPISLTTQLFVEKQTGSGWITVASNLTLAEECPAGALPMCTGLNAGATLRPVRWTGFSCSGQCAGHCKKNVYLGPGTFRLTALTCDRTVSFHSAPFHLPPSPAKE
jgi:hypothetical protein